MRYRASARRRTEPPIIVARHGDTWQIRNGRHRLLAAVMAGRADVLCVEESS